VEPTAGQVIFEGRDLVKLNRAELRSARRRIGMVFQEYNLVERLSVMENLLCGRPRICLAAESVAAPLPRARHRPRIRAARHRRPRRIRAGARRQPLGRTAPARRHRTGGDAGAEALLADEPTSSLDPKTSVEIMGLLQTLAQAHGFPVIINIHNVELARRFAERIVGMTGGRVVYDARRSESPSSTSRRSTVARTGSNRGAFPPDWWARGAWVVLLVYLVYACAHWS